MPKYNLNWVSWSGPSAPANPTGNPNFNLKNRPEVNKSGPDGGRCYKHSANKLVDILSGDILGVDISSIYGS
jgi:hypothetical protein